MSAPTPLSDLAKPGGPLERYKRRPFYENELLIDSLDWARMLRDLAQAIEQGWVEEHYADYPVMLDEAD